MRSESSGYDEVRCLGCNKTMNNININNWLKVEFRQYGTYVCSFGCVSIASKQLMEVKSA